MLHRCHFPGWAVSFFVVPLVMTGSHHEPSWAQALLLLPLQSFFSGWQRPSPFPLGESQRSLQHEGSSDPEEKPLNKSDIRALLKEVTPPAPLTALLLHHCQQKFNGDQEWS